MSSILVTGGSGFIGRAFWNEASKNKSDFVHYCFASRTPEAHAGYVTSNNISLVEMDIAKPINARMSIDIVVHMAGNKRNMAMMREVNVEGTRRLVKWAAEHGCRKFVYLGSAGVYGAGNKAGFVTENRDRCPSNEYERTKYLAEQVVRENCPKAGMNYCILQPTNVFGTWESRPLFNFIRFVSTGYYITFGSSPVHLNYVPVEDVAKALMAVASGKTCNETYILNSPVLLEDAVEAITSALSLDTARRIRIPFAIGWVVASCFGLLEKWPGLTVPFNQNRLKELTNETYYDGSLICERQGFVYSVGTTEGLRRLALRYREMGFL